MPAPTPAVLTADSPHLAGLVASALRHLTIDRIATASGSADTLKIDKVTLGEATVERVTIENLGASVQCGAALLRNVRMIMEMHFKVRWAYDLGWFGADSGIKDLGSKAKTMELHDINLPRLEDIDINVPLAEIEDVAASIEPIENLDLGGGSFENLAIDDMRLPTDGFGLAGMGIESFELGSFGAPASDSRQMTLTSFAPNAPLGLPELSLTGIEVPQVAVPDAGSDGPVSINGIELEEFEAPVFKIGKLFKANFLAVPILHLQIGELVLTNLSASASVEAARVQGISAPVAIEGLTLGGLTLRDLSVNQVTL